MTDVPPDPTRLRREYEAAPLRRADLHPDPVQQFARWFRDAQDAEILDANAMALATIGADGIPGLRTVLLKAFDQRGFCFYTNLRSRKSRDIQRDPAVALLFHWAPLSRQVRIEGRAERTTRAEDAHYFATRPRESQIGAWISEQSAPIRARDLLLQAFAEMKARFLDGQVPLPVFWGGYRVVPRSFEFWQGQANRLHDRFLYTREGEAWTISRLQP
jgi:pyridoxamine 5'-phosphate oxidase